MKGAKEIVENITSKIRKTSFSSIFIKIILAIQIIFVLFVLLVSLPQATIIFIFFFIIDLSFWIVYSKSNEYKDIVTVIFLILFFSPIIVYSLVYYINIHILPNYPSLISLGSVDSWITFAGSIIGGTTVLFALVFTISNEKNRQIENLKLLKHPKLILVPEESENTVKLDMKSEFNQYLSFILSNDSHNFIIKNIEIFEAQQSLYDEIDFILDENPIPFHSIDNTSKIQNIFKDISMIFENKKVNVIIPITHNLEQIKDYRNFLVLTNISLKYKSEIDHFYYVMRYRIETSVSLTANVNGKSLNSSYRIINVKNEFYIEQF